MDAMTARSSSPIRQDQATNKRLSTITSTGGFRLSQGLPDFETLLASGASLKVTGIGPHRAIEALGENVDEDNESDVDAEQESPVVTIRQRQPAANSASRISNVSSESRQRNGRDRAFNDLEREMASSPDHSNDDEKSQTPYSAFSAQQRSMAARPVSQNRSPGSVIDPARAASPTNSMRAANGTNGRDTVVSPFANLLRLGDESGRKTSAVFSTKPLSGDTEQTGSLASGKNSSPQRHERNISSGSQFSNTSNTAASTFAFGHSVNNRAPSPNDPVPPMKSNGTAASQASLTASRSSDLPEAVRLQRELEYWKRTEQTMRSSPSINSTNGLAIDSRASNTAKRQSLGSVLPKLAALPGSSSPAKGHQRGISSTSPVLVSGSLPSPDLTQSPIFPSPIFGTPRHSSPSKGNRDGPSVSSPKIDPRSLNAGSSYSNTSLPPSADVSSRVSPSPRERGALKDRQSKRQTTDPDSLRRDTTDRTLSRFSDGDDDLRLGLGISPERLARITQPKPPSPALPSTHSPRLSSSNGPSHSRSLSFTIDPTKDSPSTATVAMFPVAQQQPQLPESTRMTPTKIDTSVRSSGSTAVRSRHTTAGSDDATTLANKCWEEDESFLKREKIAEWLGSNEQRNRQVLIAYMQNFDFAGLRLDFAFRKLCEKLYVRAETQQVDRIIAAFALKYFDDNRTTIFGDKDVIHAVAYAVLLLNTDLHIAEVPHRMSRSDFVGNTLTAIRAQNSSQPPSATTPVSSSAYTPSQLNNNEYFEELSSSSSAARSGLDKWRESLSTLPRLRHKVSSNGPYGLWRGSGSDNRGSTSQIARIVSSANLTSSPIKAGGSAESSPVTPYSATLGSPINKTWESEIESILKDIYSAVKHVPITQPLSMPESAIDGSQTDLSIRRTASRRSQLIPGYDKGTKRQSMRGFLGGQSQDNLRSGMASPTPSHGTSMSGTFSGKDSMGSSMNYPASMGFASSLKHTLVREQIEEDRVSLMSEQSITDEELALLGAPWAKEGILQRKHYWEETGKRSRDKTWQQVFAVIAKSDLKLFQFGSSSTKGNSGPSTGLGGGNWLDNAEGVGNLSLAHALCSALPPPGYNRSRPHVFVLSLPDGGSFFFQAGTADLVNEWVLSCNYWAGRSSKEPLMGGVSSANFGWNDVLPDHTEDTEDLVSVMSGRSRHSARSRMSYAASLYGNGGLLGSLERSRLHDWVAPKSPTTISLLSEDAQLQALRRHVKTLEADLQSHNQLRAPMQRLYLPRSADGVKALSNWEKKSKYLLAESVKYQTYIDALLQARSGRQARTDHKRLNRLLETADDDAGLDDPRFTPVAEQTKFSPALPQ